MEGSNKGSNDIFLEANFLTLKIPGATRNALRNTAPRGVAIEKALSGAPQLAINGRPVYGDPHPLASVRQEVAGIEGDADTAIIALFGLGLGYHAEQLERRFSGRIVIFDPMLDVVKTTLGARLLPLKRTKLVSDLAHLLADVQPRLQFAEHKIIAAAMPAYAEQFPEELAAFKTVLEEALSNAHILENTAQDRTSGWIRFVAENLKQAAQSPPINILKEYFKGTPGIVVAAGPSLDRNIADLKNAMGHALIIGVNAAARPLSCAGIKPDIVAVVESLDLRAQLADIDWLKNTALAPTLNTFPKFFDLPARHIFPIADSSIPCSDWLSRAFGWDQFPSGGSVACTAFSILHTLGCDPIILVGQDLAYTEGYSYSEAATYGRQKMAFDQEARLLNAMERNKEIETIRGKEGLDLMIRLKAVEAEAYGGEGTVLTTHMFNLFRSWFETAARTWAKDRTLINATQGGIRIREFEELTLKQAIECHCAQPVPASEWIDRAVAKWSPPDMGALYDAMKKDLDAISTARDTAEQAKHLAATVRSQVKANGFAAAEPAFRSLGALEQKLRAIARQSPLLDAFMAGPINRLRLERRDDIDPDPIRQAINSLKRSEDMFDIIKAGSEELTHLFDPQLRRAKKINITPQSAEAL
ncbi:MAG: DUF115 domain-containing protein [Myxococcota bacterium]|nr:DUF115 domain-containing protein [Myxococcota bacterium]